MPEKSIIRTIIKTYILFFKINLQTYVNQNQLNEQFFLIIAITSTKFNIFPIFLRIYFIHLEVFRGYESLSMIIFRHKYIFELCFVQTY